MRSTTAGPHARVQTEVAIRDADIILFLVDAKSGLLPDDKTFADIVRRAGKLVVLVANKAEARGAGATARSLGTRAWRTGACFGRTRRGHAGSARGDRRSTW